MEVAIGCKKGARDCDDLVPPTKLCDNPLVFASFTYDPAGTCEKSDNEQDDDGSVICDQLAPLTSVVSITCVNGETGAPLPVNPPVVSSGTEVVLFNGSGQLPESVDCSIIDPSGVTLQRISIELSGSDRKPLRLQQSFGALTVKSCDSKTCEEEVTLSYTVKNVGGDALTITDFIREITGEIPSDLFPLLPKVTLVPEESVSVTEQYVIDLCSTNPLDISVTVNGDPPNGPDCEGTTTKTIEYS